MCSASSRITRSRMSRPTSTSSRSAPLPPRSTAIACSVASAWVTEAPLSMAILVAVVSWPFSVPTMRSRMLVSCPSVRADHARAVVLVAFRLDDFRHGDAELVFHQHDAAVGPFDPAVAGCDIRLGQDHQPALEAALGSLSFDLFARRLVKGVVDADHEMRRRDQMREAVAHQRGDLAERLGGNQLAA